MASIKELARQTRDLEMIDLFLYGFCLTEIGAFYSLNRERVRQVVKENGISRLDGGRPLMKIKNKHREIKAKEKRTYAQFGCSVALYLELKGDNYRRSPLWKFIQQRKNARKRNIKWDLTLTEWWAVWEGKFHKRGRNKGQFVMSRYGDKGAYSINNVEIVTCTENIIERYKREFGGDYSETLNNRNVTMK